jgi:hypothetical protein
MKSVERRQHECRERIAALSARIHALNAELVEALAELDSTTDRFGQAGWQVAGAHTMAAWLSSSCGFTPSDARRICAAVPAVESVPELLAAAHDGDVSVGMLAAAADTAAATAGSGACDTDMLTHVVLNTTPAQATRVLSTFADVGGTGSASSGTGADAAERPRPTHWWRTWTDDRGRGRIDAAVDAATADLLERAWAAAQAVSAGDDASRPDVDTTAAAMATTVIDHAHSAGLRTAGGDDFRVQVHIDLATLAELWGEPLDGRPVRLGTECFSVESGRRLTADQVEQALCGGGVQTLIEHRGVPLWLGNEVRSASHQQRRALRMRSGGAGGCEFPGCTHRRFVDAHHVTHHGDGGRTDPANLVMLCSWHHRELHRRRWRITTDGTQQFTFWNGTQNLGTSTIARDPTRSRKRGAASDDCEARPQSASPTLAEHLRHLTSA